MRPTTNTPAQQRLVDQLLAWDEPRPLADPQLPGRLAAALTDGVEPNLARVPDGEDLWIGKTALKALVCEGRFLDLEATPFAWSRSLAAGQLVHRAVEVDHRTSRTRDVAGTVRWVWEDQASGQAASLAGYLNGLDDVAAADLEQSVVQDLREFRDLWPALPPAAAVRSEQPVRWTDPTGTVTVSGKPDLVIGDVRDRRRRMLIIDFKTGSRHPHSERQDLRLYALLSTLKYGVAPFKCATYYLREGDWDAEEVTEELLGTAVRRVVDGVAAAARLRFDPPADEDLTLRAGAYCRWCTRAPTCPAAEP